MMTPSTRPPSFVLPLCVLSALLLAALACQADNMRARDLPVWTCPTEAPPATHTMQPGWELLTPPPATYTPYPTPTPFQLLTDFPLGKHVQIGGVGGIGLGIWVWMDDVAVDGPFFVEDPDSGAETTWWAAAWDVTVENASLTNDYEFYPFAQLYVLEVIEADGLSHTRGAWGVSGEAHDLAGVPPLELSEAATLLEPGDQRTVRAAALIPAPDAWRLAYVLDPLDTEDIDEMVANNSIGSNVGVWVNTTDDRCQGEVTLVPGPVGTRPAPGFLLARHPVDSVSVERGFGCSAFFTGELGSGCPASEPWFHNGADYAGAQGAPYIDPLGVPGQVVYAGDNPSGPDCSAMPGSQPPHQGYGNFVKHTAMVAGHRVELWGAHLSSSNVATGEPTSPGDTLGFVGSTGCSTGPHLHFSARVDGLYVDPLTLIP